MPEKMSSQTIRQLNKETVEQISAEALHEAERARRELHELGREVDAERLFVQICIHLSTVPIDSYRDSSHDTVPAQIELLAYHLTRIIHGHFCCNCGFAAATSQHAASAACCRADSPLGRSTDCFKSASLP
ncbi:MAG: hypothetical protein NW700_18705, partial [Nitrospiraceae bacterium]